MAVHPYIYLDLKSTLWNLCEQFKSSFVYCQFDGQNLLLYWYVESLTIQFSMTLELFLQSIVKFASITPLTLCWKFPLNFIDVVRDGWILHFVMITYSTNFAELQVLICVLF